MSLHLGGGGGGFTSMITGALDPLNLTGMKGAQAQQGYTDTMNQAKTDLGSGYDSAKSALNTGMNTATDTAKTGFQKASDTAKTGYDAAHSELTAGGNAAVNTAKTGFDKANAALDTDPNMVASRAEIYNRILGNGGLSADTVNQMEGKTREEYGTGLAGAKEAISGFQGDSGASGLAEENLGRVAATLGTNRANSVRDIETQNKVLARQEQTGAISTAESEAYQRAGLNSQEAEYVSGLQEKVAEGGANLTAQETNALSTLAANEGTTLADLQARLATGGAALSAEEATALANLTAGTAGNIATMQNKPGGLGSLFGTG